MKQESQRLFFIEICISVIFFLMIAVTCFVCFTKSKLIQINTDKQNTYVNITENAAETFLSANSIDSVYEKFSQEFDPVTITENLITYQTDDYQIRIDLQDAEDILTAIITVSNQQEPVYQLSVKKAKGELS